MQNCVFPAISAAWREAGVPIASMGLTVTVRLAWKSDEMELTCFGGHNLSVFKGGR